MSSKKISKRKVDHYKALGLERTAENKDIKDAFYKLSKQYHPDVNKEEGAVERFQDITDAYEILSSQDARAAYDRQTQMEATSVVVTQRRQPVNPQVQEDYTQFFKTRMEQRKAHDSKRTYFKSRSEPEYKKAGLFTHEPFDGPVTDEDVNERRAAAVGKRLSREDGNHTLFIVAFFIFLSCVFYQTDVYIPKGYQRKTNHQTLNNNGNNNK